MNIFYLDKNVDVCAKHHCDKHVVKMTVETAQLLSTAHRVLDGTLYFELSKKNRKVRRYRLDDEREQILYKASHINHQCNVWARKSSENYLWLFDLLNKLLAEYTFRYSKIHKTQQLVNTLSNLPKNISFGKFSDPPLCMPDYCKLDNSIDSYRNFYRLEKISFLKYSKREIPNWI